jgi:hypothetical protein
MSFRFLPRSSLKLQFGHAAGASDWLGRRVSPGGDAARRAVLKERPGTGGRRPAPLPVMCHAQGAERDEGRMAGHPLRSIEAGQPVKKSEYPEFMSNTGHQPRLKSFKLSASGPSPGLLSLR